VVDYITITIIIGNYAINSIVEMHY